jgi:hypothetical protein
MSTDQEGTRIVRSWMEEGVTRLPDRVLDSVLDQLPATPQRRATRWPAWRFHLMSSPLRWGAAAVVVAILLTGAVLLYGNGGFGTGSSTPEPSVSQSVSQPATPVASGSLPGSGSITEGAYTIAAPFPVQLRLDIGPGWTMWSGGVEPITVAMYKGSPNEPAGLALGFLIVDNVFADPCDESAGVMDPPVGPEPIDLADALIAQTGTESTDPAPVEIDGYSGVYLDYRNTGDGDCGSMVRWPGRQALVGERDQVWILDVDGTRLVIDAASFAGTSVEDLAETRSMVEGLQIRP